MISFSYKSWPSNEKLRNEMKIKVLYILKNAIINILLLMFYF